MVDDLVPRLVVMLRQQTLSNCHPHAMREALPKRARRYLCAGRQAVLRMSRRLASPLAKLPYVVQRQRIARQVQQGVEQHRGMPRRQHETIPVRPRCLLRVVLQEPVPQRIGHRRSAHRRARMPAVRLLNRVDGQEPDSVDTQPINIRFRNVGRQSRPPKLISPTGRMIRDLSSSLSHIIRSLAPVWEASASANGTARL